MLAMFVFNVLHRYDEPWGQMQPVRHALGALLLEQGRVAEAEEIYRQDLAPGRHPKNPWSLHGLVKCLKSSKSPELANYRAMLQTAQELADFNMKASCACAGLRVGSCSKGAAPKTNAKDDA